MNNQYHEMAFEKKLASGADEWVCPVCGRRVIISWEPTFKRTVLDDGDPTVSHSAFKNGQQMDEIMASPLTGEPGQDDIDSSVDESRLAPWREWLEKSHFDELWNGDIQ